MTTRDAPSNELPELSFGGVSPVALMIGAAVVLVLLLVARSVHRRMVESSGSVPAGEVVGVIGRPGSGKTLFGVRLAYAHLQAGSDVCSNFKMKLPDDLPGTWRPFTGWDELIELTDCVVILDEAHLIAPSAGAGVQALPEEARWYLSQVRRMGVSLIWITQNETRVAKQLRELTNYIWRCNSYRGGKSFKATMFEPEKLNSLREGQHLEIRRWKADPKLFELFDSWELLQTGKTSRESDRRIRELADRRNKMRHESGQWGAGRTAPKDSSEPVETERDEIGE